MTIDKEYWKNLNFVEGNFPSISCPTCAIGQLKPQKSGIVSELTSGSKAAGSDPDWSPDWRQYRFTIILKCDNNRCDDTIVCLGIGTCHGGEVYDEVNGDWDEHFWDIYEPKYFYPSLKIIPVFINFPQRLVEELNNSFSHFFSDLTSCANKIRICVEVLMDEQGINKTNIVRHKRRPLSLHERIELFKSKFPEIGHSLLAIKWIGNSGSHYDTLTKDDVLDAYTLLDFSLSKLYNNQEKAIKKLAMDINKKKAPLSRKRSK